MGKRFCALLLSCLLFLFCLPGCSSESVLRLPVSEIPTGLDPQISANQSTESIINNLYEGLVRMDEDGNIISGVASSYDISSDGTVYTFHLRSDAVWHTDESTEEVPTQVTANDFVFALQRALDPETASPYADTLLSIKNAAAVRNGEADVTALGVTATNDTTLVIELEEANSNFLAVLTTGICMPCNQQFFESTTGRYGISKEVILSNGPYAFSDMNTEDGYITLTKSDSYTGDYEASADTLYFIQYTEEQDIIASLQEEDGLSAGIVSASAIDTISSDFRVTEYKNTVRALLVNADGTLGNRYVRCALFSATDRNLLTADPADGIVPEVCLIGSGSSYRETAGAATVPAYSLNAAAAYLEQAELTEGTVLNVEVACLEADQNNIKAVIQNWQKLFGVSLNATVTAYATQAELDAAVSAGNFDIAYTSLVANALPVTSFLASFSSGNTDNVIRISSTTYDNLLIAAATESGVSSLLEAENALIQAGFILPVEYESTYLVPSPAIDEDAVFVMPFGNVYSAFTQVSYN